MVSTPNDTVYTTGPNNVSAYSRDASGIQSITLYYKHGNGSFNNLSMTRSTTVDSLFTATIPFGGWGKRTDYYIIAIDSSSAHNSTTFPVTGYKSYFSKFPSGGLITIGNGTSVDMNLPIEPYYGYTYSQSLYNASFLQTSGIISKISYYAVSTSGYGPDNFRIYMGNSTKTSFSSSTDWEPVSNLTLVYDGTLTVPAGGGWIELTLTTPFNYNGLGSLVVGAKEFTTGYHNSGDDFQCTQYPNGGNVSIVYFNDNTIPDPASPPTANGISNYLPNTKFLLTSSLSLTQDAGISQIINPAGGVTANSAFNVEAKIKNFGNSVLTKATVKYSVDGNNPATYIWNGSLNKDSVSTTFVAGILNLPIGGHSLKVWAELPNDSLDLNNINDTAYISFYACASPLSGNYTLGGATANFASFADALIGLTQCGINGAVVFNVNPGTYNSQITIPEIFGASATNTITFKAANNDSTSVIMNYSASSATDNWIVKLNAADYIIFKNINFAPANTTYSNAIVFTNGACHNQISGNLFTGNPGTTNDLASVRIEDYNSIYNTISGNQFNSGSAAIMCKGISTTSLLSNITIKNNTINGFTKYGIFGEYVNKMLVEGNLITSDVSTTDKFGINMHYAYDTVKVLRNNISLNGASNTYGILFDNCHASDTTRGLIANNMISITNGTNYTYGIRTLYTEYQKVYFNSVIVNGANLSDTRSINIATSSSNIDILNNNLQSNRYPLHVEVNNTGKCDYNNYYATGSVFVLWNNTAYANFQTLRAASLKDSNSISVNPYFISLSNLHTFNGLLSGAGKFISEITNDFDGNLRANPPCIGADEFLPPANDATLISVITRNTCGLTTNENVTVIIKNIGTAAIAAANLTASYGFIGSNNTLVNIVPVEVVNRTIAAGDTVHYTFATKANLSVAATHIDSIFQIKAWVKLIADISNANDTSMLATLSSFTPVSPVVTNFNCAYGSPVTITAVSSDSLYWYDAITAGNLLYNGLNYTTVPLFSTTNFFVEAKASSPAIVQIGTGTSSQYYPFDISYGYARSASVYKSSEIGGHGMISAIQYQVATSSSTAVPLKIYLKEISPETMNSENWASLTTSAVLVYDASVTFDQSGWKNIPLTTPYNFSSGNLMILCEANYGGYGGYPAPYFNYTSSLLGTHQSVHQDNSAPTGNLSLNSNRPNVKLNIKLAGCASPRVAVTVSVAPPPPIDLGTIQITSPTLSVPAAVIQPVNIKIKNFGMLSLTSANINYRIDNGNVTTYGWTATTPLAFDSSKVVNVANLAFTPGSHKIKAWTSNPNNIQDTVASNDTLTISFLASLHGTYTLGDTTGGVQKDFPSFTSANAALDSAGVCDNVIFLVDSGTYNERLLIGAKAGMNANARVTFTSATGDSTDVVLHYTTSSSAAWAMKFNGSSYFKFTKMTLSVAGGNTYSRIMELALNANHIEISNCVIEGIPSTSTSDYYALIYANGAGLNYNTFKNNLLLNGSYAFYLNGQSVSGAKGNIISNNKISSFYNYGIYSYYQDSIQIVKNKIQSITSSYSCSGIYAYNNNNAFQISKNSISINSNSTYTWGSLFGINLDNCISTSTNKGLVSNNTIAIEGGTATASIYGLYCNYSEFQNLYFNSVNMISAFTGSAAFYVSGGSEIKAINNNFANNGGGYAYYSDYSGITTSDYNNLYTSGNILASYNYTNKNTLADFQAATSKDVHSIALNPPFVSNNDLHLLTTTISASATPLAEVTDDIDGGIRHLTAPTIGAVEFPLYQHDAGVIAILTPVAADTEGVILPIRVIVKNFGVDTITAMPVYYKVNNGTAVLFNYTGSLASLKVDTLTLSSFTVPAGNYSLCAYTALAGDINQVNNQNCKNLFGIPLSDAQIVKITPINGGCNLTTDIVKVWIKNKGINTMNSGYSVSYKRIGENAITTETVLTSIISGDSLYYSFNTPVNLAVTSQDSNYHIKAWVTLNQDNNHANDTAFTNVKSLHTPANPLVTTINIPYGTSANITATSSTNDPLYWYDLLIGGNLLNNGSNYISPVLYVTDTFFVEARTGFSANITLGNGTVTTGYPFYSYYMDSRTEMLYKASELTAQNLVAGNITSLAFDVANFDPATLNGFTIKMQNYTPNSISGFHSSGWQTVYSSSYSVPGTGWQAIQLQTPFVWDGVSNVLVGVCFDNSAYTNNSEINTTNVPDCVYHGHTDLSSGNGCTDITSGSVYADRPNIKFIASVAGCSSQRMLSIVNVGAQSPKDAGVVEIISPSTAVNLTNNETIKVRIKNYGSTSISNFSISYKIGNNLTVNQVITDVINANDTLVKSFTQTADLSSNTQPQSFAIKAWTTLTNDATVLNDTTKKTVINNLPVYCPSTATSTGDEDIGNVNFAGINNGVSTPVLYNTNANQMYNDYTGLQTASIQPGMSYPISVSVIFANGGYTGLCNVYIDYNRNGIWDLPEELAFTSVYDEINSTVSGNVVVPYNAIPGFTRMRVVVDESDMAPSCGTYSWGETEDYRVNIIPPIPHDAGINKMNGIGTFLANTASNSQTPQFFIRNYGSSLLTAATMNYVLNNAAPITHSWTGSLLSLGIDSVIQNLTLTPGMNTIKAYTNGVIGDSNHNNDTLNVKVFKEYKTTPPYTDNFEVNKYWFPTDTVNGISVPNLWAQGIPSSASPSLNAAHSSFNVWATNLSANYTTNNTSILYTPVFDISTMQPDTLKFWQWHQFGSGASGQIEYKNSTGAWLPLGIQNDTSAVNWYNDVTNMWVGIDTTWKLSKFRVKNLTNLGSTVQFRYVFNSGSSTTTMKGWAIDDFELQLASIPFDAGVTSIVSPTSTSQVGDNNTVTVTVKNFGTNSLTNIPVKYQIGSGAIQSGILAGPLAPGATTSYTFTQTFLTGIVNYSICAYTQVVGDLYTQNDKFCKTVTVNPAANDVGITQILEPGISVPAGTTTIVKVTIKNYGTTTQTSIPVAYRRSTLTPINETWVGSLAAGASVDYTFTTIMNVPNGVSLNLCAYTVLPNDAYGLNDSTCRSIALGIDDIDADNFWLAQNTPNPTTGFTNIEYSLPSSGEIKFDIINFIGQKIYSSNQKMDAGKHVIDLNVKDLSTGIYYYTIEFKGKRLVKKMVVNK
ncbi:MAG: GEVED domain-containing protein [Bacteroidales bacterium]